MKHNILVHRLSMVTNAKKFPKLALEAFNDYQKYCMYGNIKSEVTINFSFDPFHENYPGIRKEYYEKYPQFKYELKGLPWIWKTGRAEYGDKFEYNILPMHVQLVMDYFWVMNSLYVTAKGNYETMGDGMYSDMDRIHMGSVFDNTLLDLLDRYGKATNFTEEEFKSLLYRCRNQSY